MTLAVTDQAAGVIKQILDSQQPEPDQVLRIVTDSEGNHSFLLDEASAEDQKVQHEGETVLVLDPIISEDLDGNILDLKDTPEGPGLVLYR